MQRYSSAVLAMAPCPSILNKSWSSIETTELIELVLAPRLLLAYPRLYWKEIQISLTKMVLPLKRCPKLWTRNCTSIVTNAVNSSGRSVWWIDDGRRRTSPVYHWASTFLENMMGATRRAGLWSSWGFFDLRKYTYTNRVISMEQFVWLCSLFRNG